MKSKIILRVLAILAISSFIVLQSCIDDINGPNELNQVDIYQAELSKHFISYEVVEIDAQKIWDIAKQKPQTIVNVDLGIESHPEWNLFMVEDDLSETKSEDFKSFAIEGENQIKEVEPLEAYALKGQLNNSSDTSYIILSLGQLEANIITQNEEYMIEPVSNFVNNAPINKYVVYKPENLIIEDNSCPMPQNENGDISNETQGNRKYRPWRIEVTYIGDYQLYRKFNSNFYRTVQYMYNGFYWASRRYADNNTAGRLVLKVTYLYTGEWSRDLPASDIYNAQNFNNQFASKCYYESWYNNGDVNYYFTGKDVLVPNNIIGWAYIGVICHQPQWSFGWGEYQSSTTITANLMAHEVGHMLGADHDYANWNIMHGTINWNKRFNNRAKWQFGTTMGSHNSCLTVY